ncbi:sialic acid-binding Ig-like lectin 14 [Pelobates cultripes]|uniref:Sialic acid-binding Ig-like lectin 14 n=1 Tax=Pelobates cultripes TaxID=61616 RepID=A0AAD1RJ03_PELCU|nr:sialic acid-binding Ig-like lectin 14 [Pelobates cultripes]
MSRDRPIKGFNNNICSLILTGQHHSEFTINQPEESSAPVGGSATITCSYNTPIKKTPINAVIYWRASGHDGPIAYHPSTWMVHPTYRGRTNVTQQADLQITGVQHTDSSVYYCLVTLKFCVGNGVIKNSISCGNGTRLSVTAANEIPVYQIIIPIIFVFILIVVGGILIFRKGFLCKKEHETTAIQQNVNEPVAAGDPSNEGTREEMPYEEINGGIIYADLKMTKLDPGQSRSQPNRETEIIYSYVK